MKKMYENLNYFVGIQLLVNSTINFNLEIKISVCFNNA